MAVDNPYTGGKTSLDELYRARMATRHLEEASRNAAKNSPYAAIRRNVDANTLIMEQSMEDRMATAATNGLSSVTGTPKYGQGNAAGFLKFNPPVDPTTGKLSATSKPRTMASLMEAARLKGQEEQAATNYLWKSDQLAQARKKNPMYEFSKVTPGSAFAGIATELIAGGLRKPEKLTPSSELPTSASGAKWLPDTIDPTWLSQETFIDPARTLYGKADNPQTDINANANNINPDSPLFSKSAKSKLIQLSNLSVGDDNTLVADVSLLTSPSDNFLDDQRSREYTRVRTSIKFDDNTMVKTKDGKAYLFRDADEKNKYVSRQTSTTNALT